MKENGRGGTHADVEVAVIGAGPHGVSAAVHLRRAGHDVHVFGRPMAFWRSMPEGMLLRSNRSATNMVETAGPLSLAAYGRESGHTVTTPVPLEDFIAYGDWVIARGLPPVDERIVTVLEREGARFRLSLQDGQTVHADRVVIAAGIEPFARRPAGFEHLPPGRVSHTSEHRTLSPFRGRRVLLVGGGQSAFETAALMTEQGASAEVLVRAHDVVWLRGHAVKPRLGRLGDVVYAPTDVGPLWYSRLVSVPDLFRRLPRAAQDRIARRSIRPACSHFVRVRLDRTQISRGVFVTGAEERGTHLLVRLSDGSRREVDHLVFGTGYQVDFARYPFLGEDLRRSVAQASGFPVLRRGLETSVPRLHVAGAPAAWSFGPIMRFISGSWYAGRAIARAAAA